MYAFKMLGIETLSMLEYSNSTDLGGSTFIDVYHHRPKGFRPQLKLSFVAPEACPLIATVSLFFIPSPKTIRGIVSEFLNALFFRYFTGFFKLYQSARLHC